MERYDSSPNFGLFFGMASVLVLSGDAVGKPIVKSAAKQLSSLSGSRKPVRVEMQWMGNALDLGLSDLECMHWSQWTDSAVRRLLLHALDVHECTAGSFNNKGYAQPAPDHRTNNIQHQMVFHVVQRIALFDGVVLELL